MFDKILEKLNKLNEEEFDFEDIEIGNKEPLIKYFDGHVQGERVIPYSDYAEKIEELSLGHRHVVSRAVLLAFIMLSKEERKFYTGGDIVRWARNKNKYKLLGYGTATHSVFTWSDRVRRYLLWWEGQGNVSFRRAGNAYRFGFETEEELEAAFTLLKEDEKFMELVDFIEIDI